MIDSDPFALEVENEDIIVCWRDQTRACSADCAAFDSRAESDERFRPCLILNLQRQQSHALTNLAKALEIDIGESQKRQKLRDQLEMRVRDVANLPAPPEVK